MDDVIGTQDLTAGLQADARLIASRRLDLPPHAGRPTPYVQETGFLSRYGRFLILSLPAIGIVEPAATTVIAPSETAAKDEFDRQRAALEADGWTLRDPEPWEGQDFTGVPS